VVAPGLHASERRSRHPAIFLVEHRGHACRPASARRNEAEHDPQRQFSVFPARFEFAASPVIAGHSIYAVDLSDEAVVVQASDTFKFLTRNPLGQALQSPPAIAAG
jgi:hypothetical protein